MPTVTVQLPKLSRPQADVLFDSHRYRVVAACRRWGKTYLGVVACLDAAIDGKAAWWVAPSYPIAEIGWREIRGLVRQIPGHKFEEVDRIARLPGGGWIQVKSALDPDSLRGEGLDLVVLDEAAFMAEEAWMAALRPALADKQGLALFISSSNGPNWFHKLYLRGQDQADTEWQSWLYLPNTAYNLTGAEVAEAENTMPQAIFRREFLVDFTAEVGQVFRHVVECVQGELALPIPGHSYIFGVDLGKHQDFTVIIGADAATLRVVFFDRFNQIDWVLQKERIRQALTRYHRGRAWLDSTGEGEPIFEDLRKSGLSVEGYHFTGPSKKVLIDGLIVALEQERIRFPRIPQLINELEAYEYQPTKAGNLKTGAPAGEYYDDCVVALALCNWGLNQSGGGLKVTGYSLARMV